MSSPFLTNTLTPQESAGIHQLLFISSALILTAGTVAYMARKRNDPSLTVQNFLGLNLKYLNTERGLTIMLVGMVSGIIFGIIDNVGLWFGMSALDPYFTKVMGIPKGSNEAAGYGNLFSDGLGAFLGTFIGIIVSEYTQVDQDEAPIWVDAVGVVIGCYLGIQIGKLSGRN